MNDLYTLTPSQMVVYTTSWCSDCRRARNYFASQNITYLEVDVDKDDQANAFIKEINRGFRSVPTIVFPDGSILVEPSVEELDAKLKK